MAQLIKLQNYISRYEWDIYRYPSQFMRLKQDNWYKLHYLWSNQDQETTPDEEEDESRKSRWKTFGKRQQQEDSVEDNSRENRLPRTEEALRINFLNQLFTFQLKWATSTVSNVSFMDKRYYLDETLKYFLQRFPDNYLLLYYPIFELKKAPVESEIILISPLGVEIVYLLEENPKTIIMASDERSWVFDDGHNKVKKLSPIFALKRTEKILKSIFQKHQVDFPIKKLVLSRTNTINFLSEPYNTRIIGKQGYDAWFQEKRSLISPLKSQQLKASDAILKYCQSISVKRPEWEEDEQDNGFNFVEEE
ncbi:NERD domain-containing protein [Ornithinibacillus xuwenensis]|uniref:NERD domain-containing protein n=1 Tax=Ornithinibacillus xuwenensis TaxID=3144668 RepID=A0ABU9XLP4_9BACI